MRLMFGIVGAAAIIVLLAIAEAAQNVSRYCLTARDEQGAAIPHAAMKFMPTKVSRSRIKYNLITDHLGNIDVEIIDGIYDIEIKKDSFRVLKLKNQLLPYDPRGCIEVTLKSAVPPHQIT